MKRRHNISSGAKWEDTVGYSRAVIIDGRILISGTTSVLEGEIKGKGSVYEQTKIIIEKIKKVLEDTGSGLDKIIRTRIYLTDISKWEDAGKAHHEFFKNVKPASTMIEVKALIDPEMLVEIEAEAVI